MTTLRHSTPLRVVGMYRGQHVDEKNELPTVCPIFRIMLFVSSYGDRNISVIILSPHINMSHIFNSVVPPAVAKLRQLIIAVNF